MTPPTYGATLSVSDAAAIIGVPATQLARWAWEGSGPKFTGNRQMPLYKQEDLDAWLAHQEACQAAVEEALRGSKEG